MSDLGLLHPFLGIGVIQQEESIFIHQRSYAFSLLKRFGLKYCKPISIPLATIEKSRKDDGSAPTDEEHYSKIVGSLFYLTATRPDITFTRKLLVVTFSWAFVKQPSVAFSIAEAKYMSAS